MKILYITKHNPWGRGGGASASGMYLTALNRVFENDEIDLCISDLISDSNIPENIIKNRNIHIYKAKARSFISKMISPFSGITHRFQTLGKSLLNRNKYDYCVFDHSSIGGSLMKYVPQSTKTIVIHHNYEPDYFASNCNNALFRTLLLPTVKRNEKVAYKAAYLNIFLTAEDVETFRKQYGNSLGNNIVTGLFEQNQIESNPVKTLVRPSPTIVITGSLNNVQNTDGIKYFIDDLYPLIPDDYKIIIAGQKPNDAIINLTTGKPNIKLIANPDNMSSIVSEGNIFLSPAKSGSGIKVRITDGLKMGLPVIAHEVSARGYYGFITKGYFKSFSTPEEFSLKLKELLKAISSNEIKPEEIFAFYNDECSLEKAVSRLKQTILKN